MSYFQIRHKHRVRIGIDIFGFFLCILTLILHKMYQHNHLMFLKNFHQHLVYSR